MSAGIYKCNGVLAYSMNLEKKLKRKKNAVIIEVCEGEVSEEYLQDLLNKHNNITKKEDIETTDNPLKYHWRNKTTKETLHSIHSDLPEFLDESEWETYNAGTLWIHQ